MYCSCGRVNCRWLTRVHIESSWHSKSSENERCCISGMMYDHINYINGLYFTCACVVQEVHWHVDYQTSTRLPVLGIRYYSATRVGHALHTSCNTTLQSQTTEMRHYIQHKHPNYSKEHKEKLILACQLSLA